MYITCLKITENCVWYAATCTTTASESQCFGPCSCFDDKSTVFKQLKAIYTWISTTTTKKLTFSEYKVCVSNAESSSGATLVMPKPQQWYVTCTWNSHMHLLRGQ